VVTLRDGKAQRIYYFSKSLQSEYATDLPDGMVVRENPKNGFLALAREADTSNC
jgi:hypothetical protein